MIIESQKSTRLESVNNERIGPFAGGGLGIAPATHKDEVGLASLKEELEALLSGGASSITGSQASIGRNGSTTGGHIKYGVELIVDDNLVDPGDRRYKGMDLFAIAAISRTRHSEASIVPKGVEIRPSHRGCSHAEGQIISDDFNRRIAAIALDELILADKPTIAQEGSLTETIIRSRAVHAGGVGTALINAEGTFIDIDAIGSVELKAFGTGTGGTVGGHFTLRTRGAEGDSIDKALI